MHFRLTVCINNPWPKHIQGRACAFESLQLGGFGWEACMHRQSEFHKWDLSGSLEVWVLQIMVFINGVHIWCTYMVYIYGVLIWCTYIVYIFCVHIWCTYMVYGVHIWCTNMVYIYGVHIWCTCMQWNGNMQATMHVFIHMHVHNYAQIHTCTYIEAHKHTHTHAHTHTRLTCVSVLHSPRAPSWAPAHVASNPFLALL